MTSATVNAYDDAPEIATICALACDLSRQIGEKYEEIGDLSCRRGMALQTILVLIGRDMIANQQKTKRIGREFIVEAGTTSPERFCACHGYTDFGKCPTPLADLKILEKATGEPYIRVRPLASVKDGAS